MRYKTGLKGMKKRERGGGETHDRVRAGKEEKRKEEREQVAR